jgi:hypothetical protein
MIAPWEVRTRLAQWACFDPVTMLASVAALGSVTSAVGQISSGMAQQNAADYNAAVNRNNAIQATQAAGQQSVVAQQETNQKLGQQAAAYGASGVDVNTGSPVDVMMNTAAKGRLDAMTLRYGGQVTALGDLQAATLAKYEGAEAATSADLGAGTTLLTGAGSTAKALGYGPGSTSW